MIYKASITLAAIGAILFGVAVNRISRRSPRLGVTQAAMLTERARTVAPTTNPADPTIDAVTPGSFEASFLAKTPENRSAEIAKMREALVARIRVAQEAINANALAVETPVDAPLARQALALVGQDPVAEAFWTEAINNPDLPADERANLIEDLNETGFDDVDNLTVDDLPLIESRIKLIEALGPLAIDETNAAAFDEAYRDLLEMQDQLAN